MNILFFTTHYPIPGSDNKQTLADHYFTREWAKSGHRIVVMHNDILPVFKENPKIAGMGYHYFIENVEVFHISIKRYIPKCSYLFPGTVRLARKTIGKYVDTAKIKPDIVFIDFCLAQWTVLKNIYGEFECQIIPIFNNCDTTERKKVLDIVSRFTKIGVRSKSIEEKIRKICSNRYAAFTIYSGAPSEIKIPEDKVFENRLQNNNMRILYVGDLIELKNVDIIIRVLHSLKKEYDFHFTIIGNGKREKSLKRLVGKLEMNGRVDFKGRVDRETVIEYMINCDCFVMVSSPESFGIVYIEAMACGCYVIGSKGEGIDGVIIDGINGILVKPRDVNELKSAFLKYFKNDTGEKVKIVKNALATSKEFTEKAVARKFLEDAV